MSRPVARWWPILVTLAVVGGGVWASASGADDARAAPVARGERTLGLALSEPETGGYDAAFTLARRAGVTETSISLAWDDLEAKPGVYANAWVAIASAYYPGRGMKVTVVVNPIDTTADRRPKALRSKAWDDPAVVEGYAGVVLWVLDGLKGVPLSCLSLGNEVDVLLGTDARAWAAYGRLVADVRRRVRAKRPDLVVGVKVTSGALLADGPGRRLAAAADLDATFATYYPLGEGGRVRDPRVVAGDVAGMVAASGPRPLWLLEVGCPSGTVCGSSLDVQRRFVEEVFAAWDAHASKIPVLSFCWMHDQAPTSVDEMTRYYGLAAPAFRDFLATLGLRERAGEGRDKPAFAALVAAAKARGFAK